jgi:Ca2+-binding EF-hand superfamily protein
VGLVTFFLLNLVDVIMSRLPFLGVNIPDAKALRYFKICDTDGSGEIDVDEFKVALFICDPVTGTLVWT